MLICFVAVVCMFADNPTAFVTKPAETPSAAKLLVIISVGAALDIGSCKFPLPVSTGATAC